MKLIRRVSVNHMSTIGVSEEPRHENRIFSLYPPFAGFSGSPPSVILKGKTTPNDKKVALRTNYSGEKRRKELERKKKKEEKELKKKLRKEAIARGEDPDALGPEDDEAGDDDDEAVEGATPEGSGD